MSKKKYRNFITSLGLVFGLTLSLAAGTVSDAATCKLNRSNLCLQKGSCFSLKLKGTNCCTNWSSSNKKVASVSKKGKITAKKNGTAIITATAGKKKVCCHVTVKKPAKSCTKSVAKVTKTPVSTAAPVSTKKPVLTALPVSTKKPVSTAVPVSTKKPVSTAAPRVTVTPSASAAPVTKESGSVTEEEAYRILNSLRSTYPEGMSLTNNNYHYYSPVFGNGYGCYGFAAKLSDTIFGTTKKYTTHTDFNSIRVGDNIRIGNRHSVICLTKQSDFITVVEGNYNSSVHWDRKITRQSLQSDGYLVYTRY